jgi:hypothetical protein
MADKGERGGRSFALTGGVVEHEPIEIAEYGLEPDFGTGSAKF